MNTYFTFNKMSDNITDITVMMVTFNRLELTKQTIDSLKNSVKKPINLIIVDNHSTDETVKYLRNLINDIELKNIISSLILIENNDNLGIATARNQALYFAMNKLQTNYLSTIDNDVILPEGWLDKCIGVLENNKTYGMIGVNFESISYPLLSVNNYKIQHKKEGNLGTACMVFNRKLPKILGYFNNKDYSPFYGLEDSDWGFRVRVLGFKLGYIEENGIHLGSDEKDMGEYRKFKTKEHDSHKEKFFKICREYLSKKKSLYMNFEANLKEINDNHVDISLDKHEDGNDK